MTQSLAPRELARIVAGFAREVCVPCKRRYPEFGPLSIVRCEPCALIWRITANSVSGHRNSRAHKREKPENCSGFAHALKLGATTLKKD